MADASEHTDRGDDERHPLESEEARRDPRVVDEDEDDGATHPGPTPVRDDDRESPPFDSTLPRERDEQ